MSLGRCVVVRLLDFGHNISGLKYSYENSLLQKLQRAVSICKQVFKGVSASICGKLWVWKSPHIPKCV